MSLKADKLIGVINVGFCVNISVARLTTIRKILKRLSLVQKKLRAK